MDLSKITSINKLRTELWTCHILSEQRCLRKACEWAEDMLFHLPKDGEEKLLSKLDKELNDIGSNFNPQYEHAKSCFELQEYDRVAHIIRNHNDDDKLRFLHYFAMFKAAEKKRIDLMNEVSVNISKKALLKFNELRDSLERSMDKKEPDGWLLYVYALVLYKFNLRKKALEVIERSINLTPINWCAWYLLITLVETPTQLHSLNLPNHLFKVFMYYTVRPHLEMYDEDTWLMVGCKEANNFLNKYFQSSLFITASRAKYKKIEDLSLLKHDDSHINEFKYSIRRDDPYLVDTMEIYSNMLYVRNYRDDLAKLAYEIERIDPFTPEANACIANSFSAREQHIKAIVYFNRALRVNPDDQNAWTLIGHEYLEMKSIDKALEAYRSAIYINKRDCRAWLGLGNTYETIMSSPNVTSPNYESCLYYYSQVRKYRPKDHVTFVAMGSIYEKMGQIKEAILCMKLSGESGLFRLARLYETDGKRKEAAKAYKEWILYQDKLRPADPMLINRVNGHMSSIKHNNSTYVPANISSTSAHKKIQNSIMYASYEDLSPDIAYANIFVREFEEEEDKAARRAQRELHDY